MLLRQQRNDRDGWNSGRLWTIAGLTSLLMMSAVANGAVDDSPSPPTGAAPRGAPEESSDRFSIHWQATYVEQETLGFNAPYSGANSLSAKSGRETVDITLFAGARLWSGAEVWINP